MLEIARDPGESYGIYGELTARRSIASFLLPIFASYKALKTSDPAQLTPWLMYWVVFACALLVESWTEWILTWYVFPFLSFIPLPTSTPRDPRRPLSPHS